MNKIKIFIILVLVIIAFGAGFWFKEDVLKLSDGFSAKNQEFKKIDIGVVISEAKKEILTSSPLNVGRASNEVVLLKSKIILETNKQRVANGLPELSENNMLNQAAGVKANDMFKNQYFEHVSPTGVNPGVLVENSGYKYIITGENLILGNFKGENEVVQDWMNSPGHRANILNLSYTEIGVSAIKGIYKGETVWIAVQEFGLPITACSEPNESLKNQIETKQEMLKNLGADIDNLKNQIDNTNQSSVYYNDLIDNYNSLVQRYNSLAQELKTIVIDYNNQVNFFNNCVSSVQDE
jgi:uncharacterized protein YkwD